MLDLTGKKLSGLLRTKFEVEHCPPTSTLCPYHVISVPGSSPFFVSVEFLLNAKQRTKNGGGLEMRLQPSVVIG